MSESEFSATEGVENDPIKLFEQSVDDLQVCFEAIGVSIIVIWRHDLSSVD